MNFKKIIAREFLISLTVVFIVLCIFGFCILNNRFRNEKLNKTKKQVNAWIQPKRDSLTFVLSSISAEEKKEIDFLNKNGQTYDEWLRAHIDLPYSEKLYTEISVTCEGIIRLVNKRDTLQKEISKANIKISNMTIDTYSDSEIRKIMNAGLLISVSILFLLRYLIYAIRWSVKTLKNN